MTITIHAQGAERKRLVQTISDWLGVPAKYCGAPTFNYEVDYFTIDRNGSLFLGYRKGTDGFPEVVPEEAIVVRRIYTRFMEGLTPGAIAKELTADGIPTPSRKQRWQTSTVESILQNEKYKGAALLQKCFTVDFLTKKRKVNEGEVPQYYVEHSHEPIITPEEFDKVQTELARRKQISRQYSGKSIFSSRIVCGDCGSYFGSKVWNST